MKSDTEMVEKMGGYADILVDVFQRHQVLTYESYREVEEDYGEIDEYVRHAIEQGCEDIETYYHCTDDFLSEWKDKVAEMNEAMEEVEALRQEIEAFNNEHRKPILSPQPIEHTLQNVSMSEQWEKIEILLQSESESDVVQGVQLLSGLGEIDAVSTPLRRTSLDGITFRFDHSIWLYVLPEIRKSSTILARTPLARTLNPVLLQAAAHLDWDKIPIKYQERIKAELGRVHLRPVESFDGCF